MGEVYKARDHWSDWRGLNAPVCYRRACGRYIVTATNDGGFTLILKSSTPRLWR